MAEVTGGDSPLDIRCRNRWPEGDGVEEPGLLETSRCGDDTVCSCRRLRGDGLARRVRPVCDGDCEVVLAELRLVLAAGRSREGGERAKVGGAVIVAAADDDEELGSIVGEPAEPAGREVEGTGMGGVDVMGGQLVCFGDRLC